jgi:WD40 repeat protein
MTEPTGSFYVTGGTLKPGEPSYVERRADTELFESLLAGELCYVLTARQMGKSSLMARTAKRLEQVGVASAIVDLTQIGSERGSQAAAQWYFGVANKIHQQLKIAEPLRPWWQERSDLSSVQRLTDFFREVVLAHHSGKVVVFVDEIDSTIGLPFADDFFAAIRACFNARATEPDFERLTFVLLGVATPDQLIRDQTRTPFNIGKRIDLTDFSREEAQGLASGLHADPGEADRRLERVLHWTGGQPYLTQALCRAVREKGEGGTAEQSVDPRVQELFLSSQAQREETNLKHARARLERPGAEGRRLLQLYRRVRQGKPVPDQPTSPLFAQIKLAGVVKATDEGRLAVRNRIYEEVFTPEWAKSAMPPDRGRQVAAATLAASLSIFLVWYAVFQPRPYEEALRAAIKDDGYNGAMEASMALHANPFSRSRATDLMQEFWEQRALRYSLAGKRDESLLSYLQGLGLKENDNLRRQAQNLVGLDYERLLHTIRYTEIVRAVAFSPDGKAFATGSTNLSGESGVVQLWDARSLKPISSPKQLQAVHLVVFSPRGQALAIGTKDSTQASNTVQVWDVSSGKPLTPSIQIRYLFSSMAFSPDGRILATGAGGIFKEDGMVQFWDATSGKPIAPPLHMQSALTRFIVFSPDEKTLATGGWTRDEDVGWLGTTHLWDARSGKPLGPSLQMQGAAIAMAFSINGRVLTTIGLDVNESHGFVQLWDAHSGELLKPTMQVPVTNGTAALSHDVQTLAAGPPLRLWDITSGKPLTPAIQIQASVNEITFSPDGRTLLTAADDRTVRLWDVRSRKFPALTSQFQASAGAATFSPDGQTLATWAGEARESGGTAQLWDARSGKPLSTSLKIQDPITALAFSPDGQTIATGTGEFGGNGTAQLWDLRSGKAVVLPLEAPINALAFSPNGRTIAIGVGDFNKGTAQLWDTHSGKPLAPPIEIKAPIISMAFSPDGQTLAIGAADLTIQFRNTRSGKPLAPQVQIQDQTRELAFSPDGRTLFVATDCWLHTYSWDGKRAIPQGNQLLHGYWKGGFHFPSDCERCLRVALQDTGDSFHLETLNFDAPNDPPIEGDPKELLKKWQERLGLSFDDEMRPVPKPPDGP